MAIGAFTKYLGGRSLLYSELLASYIKPCSNSMPCCNCDMDKYSTKDQESVLIPLLVLSIRKRILASRMPHRQYY